MTARTSWADPRAGGNGSWTHSAPHGSGLRLTRLGTVLLCLLMALLFLGAVHLGRAGMCAWHKDADGRGAFAYCSDFRGSVQR